jgi:hypothetical protein
MYSKFSFAFLINKKVVTLNRKRTNRNHKIPDGRLSPVDNVARVLAISAAVGKPRDDGANTFIIKKTIDKA